MAESRLWDINIRRCFKGAALAVLCCVWTVMGWGGWQQTGMLLFYLLIVSSDVSIVALAASLSFVFLASYNIVLPALADAPPGTVCLVLTALASIAKGRRLLDMPEGRLAGLPLSPAWVGRVTGMFALLALFSFAAAAFKSVQTVSALAFGAVFALGWWRLRSLAPAAAERGPRSAPWATALMFIAAVAMSLLVLEGGARLLLPKLSRTAEVYACDPDYIFMLEPHGKGENIIALSKHKSKTVPLYISAQGIRERDIPPKEPGEFRIAMIGDSFTMGHAVRTRDAIPRQLEDRLLAALPGVRIRVINCGIGGGGTLQELGMLRERAFPLAPDLVILQLYPGNDLDNALEVVNKRLRAHNVLWHQILADYRFRNLARFRAEDWAFRHLRAYRALRMATEKQWIISFIEDLRFVKRSKALHKPSARGPDTLEADLVQWYPELEEGLRILKSDVMQMRRECQARKIDFMAYCIPDLQEVSDKHWAAATGGAGTPGYERLKGLRLIEGFFEEQSIPHVSVVEPLRNAGAIEDVYYTFDGHLSELGNATVAGVWAGRIAGNYARDHLASGAKE
jgi:hypothetical protein